MTILTRRPYSRKTIDLAGPDGNALALMAYANTFGRQLGYSTEQLSKLRGDMMAGDYENLIRVFDEHFGSVVDLVRPSSMEGDEDE